MEYLTEVSRMFRYPFRDEGLRAILAGGAILGVLSGIPSMFRDMELAMRIILSVLISLPAWGYLGGHWLQIVRDSADGKDHQPLLPNPRLLVKTYLLPAASLGMVFLLAFAPTLALAWIGLGLTDLLATLLGLTGFCLFPMILLRHAVLRTVAATVDYRAHLDSIRRVLPPYVLCVVVTALLLAAMGLVGIFLRLISTLFLGDVEFLGILFSQVAACVLGVYFAMALLYLLGRLHHHCEEELRWSAGPETP